MNKQDWYDMGAQIGDLVQSAVDNKDFRQLNQAITDTINSTVNIVQKNVQISIDGVRGQAQYRSPKSAYQQARENAGYKVERGKPLGSNKVTVKTAGGYKGITYMGVGYTFATIFGAAAVTFLLLRPVAGFFGTLSTVFLLLTAGFAGMGIRGNRLHARVKRQKQYLQIMGERDTCTLEELAAGTGKTRKFVAKDLKSMISDGMFPQGAYLDTLETCLMTSHSAYKQYQDTTKQYELRKQEESRAERQSAKETGSAGTEKETAKELSKEVQDILREGKSFISHIHQCNDQIEEPEISEKLYRLEAVVTRIFDQVEREPKSAPDLHKMMSYYLPITRKLVDAYRDLDRQTVEGQNITKTKQEIKASLDTINTAFENLLDSFFQDTAWDVSSDITVLKTMMAQDGLMEKDFTSGEKIKTVAKDVTGPTLTR